jgi:hypothetical protein
MDPVLAIGIGIVTRRVTVASLSLLRQRKLYRLCRYRYSDIKKIVSVSSLSLLRLQKSCIGYIVINTEAEQKSIG